LEIFDPQRIIESIERKDKLHHQLKKLVKGIEKTPTGVMISEDKLWREVKTPENNLSISKRELATTMAMLLLKEHNIVTIPAVGMPGVTATIRLDMASDDAKNLDDSQIVNAITDSLQKLRKIIFDEEKCLNLLYGT
jgi:L-seryl-tRNA(Ser) seleniumtransferase